MKVYLSKSNLSNKILIEEVRKLFSACEIIEYTTGPYSNTIIDPCQYLIAVPPDGQLNLIGKGVGSEIAHAKMRDIGAFIVDEDLSLHNVIEIRIHDQRDWKAKYYKAVFHDKPSKLMEINGELIIKEDE